MERKQRVTGSPRRGAPLARRPRRPRARRPRLATFLARASPRASPPAPSPSSPPPTRGPRPLLPMPRPLRTRSPSCRPCRVGVHETCAFLGCAHALRTSLPAFAHAPHIAKVSWHKPLFTRVSKEETPHVLRTYANMSVDCGPNEDVRLLTLIGRAQGRPCRHPLPRAASPPYAIGGCASAKPAPVSCV